MRVFLVGSKIINTSRVEHFNKGQSTGKATTRKAGSNKVYKERKKYNKSRKAGKKIQQVVQRVCKRGKVMRSGCKHAGWLDVEQGDIGLARKICQGKTRLCVHDAVLTASEIIGITLDKSENFRLRPPRKTKDTIFLSLWRSR